MFSSLLEQLVEHDLLHYVAVLALVYAIAIGLCLLWCVAGCICCPRRLRNALGFCAFVALVVALSLTVIGVPSARRYISSIHAIDIARRLGAPW